jgi:hypothetical protein
MIQIIAVESIGQLSELKQQYIGQTTAPLDGMWLCGFVVSVNLTPSSQDSQPVA